MSIWGNFLIASHSASTVRSRSIFSSVSFPFGPKFYFYTPADYLCVGIVSQYIRIRVGLLSCHIVFSLVAFRVRVPGRLKSCLATGASSVTSKGNGVKGTALAFCSISAFGNAGGLQGFVHPFPSFCFRARKSA